MEQKVLNSERYVLKKSWLGNRLVLDGRSLSPRLTGDAIDLQLELGNCTVLAISYDYFDACHHWIYLLGPNGNILDQLNMPDEFGFIQEVSVQSGRSMSFGYFGSNDKWSLTVDETGFWSFKVQALLRRLNRFFACRRHLAIERTKGPPWMWSGSQRVDGGDANGKAG